MSNVFFISDTHFLHSGILKWRNKFTSIQHHNEFIIEQWNSVVTKRDLVYHLGDFAWAGNGYKMRDMMDFHTELSLITSRLNGKIKLFPGNHDDILPPNQNKRCVITQEYNNNIEIVHQGLLKYKEFWLSHCPIHPDELRGKINIHGHVHENSIRDKMELGLGYLPPDKRYINVCCEKTDYKPIKLEDIRKKCMN